MHLCVKASSGSMWSTVDFSRLIRVWYLWPLVIAYTDCSPAAPKLTELLSHSNKHTLIFEIIFFSVASLALKLQTKRLSFQHFSHCQSSCIGYRRKVFLGQVWRERDLVKKRGAGLEQLTIWKERRRGELANIDSCSSLSLGTEHSNLKSLFLYCLETVLPICPLLTAEAELIRR